MQRAPEKSAAATGAGRALEGVDMWEAHCTGGFGHHQRDLLWAELLVSEALQGHCEGTGSPVNSHFICPRIFDFQGSASCPHLCFAHCFTSSQPCLCFILPTKYSALVFWGFFLVNLCIYLFILGCTGSSLLRAGFL